jgi:hypothetical protein
MRVLVGISALLVAATGSLTAQVWREPLLTSHHVRPLNVAGAPVELGNGVILLGLSRHGLDISIRARTRGRFSIADSSLQLRIAAGPLPDGMITFRLEPARRSGGPEMLLLLPDGDDEWASIRFERIADDPPAPTLAIRRDTRVYVTVERVLNAAGQIVWEQLNSRERLWEALQAPLTQ